MHDIKSKLREVITTLPDKDREIHCARAGHCWHGGWLAEKICCWCGTKKRLHGPFIPKS